MQKNLTAPSSNLVIQQKPAAMNRLIRLFATGIVLFAALLANAQQDSTLSQKISAAFCNEFSKKDFTQAKNFDVEIGLIILPVIERYSKQIQEEWNLDAKDIGDFEKIGEKIGQEAAINCPKFLEFVKNNLNEIKEASAEDKTRSMNGIFQRIDEQQFSSLVIKTKAGKEERFWWLEFFEGSDDLLKRPASFAKKNLTIKYTTLDVYDPKLKEYRTIKVIKSLSAD